MFSCFTGSYGWWLALLLCTCLTSSIIVIIIIIVLLIIVIIIIFFPLFIFISHLVKLLLAILRTKQPGISRVM